MKTKLFFWNFTILSMVFLMGCDSSDDEEIRGDCYPDRDIFKEATNTKGQVGTLYEDPDTWIIVSMEGIIGQEGPTYDSRDVVFPCNLPDEFKEEGLVVVFSGVLFDPKDDFSNVDVAFSGLNYYYGELREIDVP